MGTSTEPTIPTHFLVLRRDPGSAHRHTEEEQEEGKAHFEPREKSLTTG